MKGKAIDGVVDAEDVLDAGSIVGGDGGDKADGKSRGRANKSSSGSDAVENEELAPASSGGADRVHSPDESSDDTRAESNGRVLAGTEVIEEHPGNSSHGGGDVSDHGGLDSAQVHGELRSSVEAEPSEPEQDSAGDDVRDGVGAVGKLGGAVACEKETASQRRADRARLDTAPGGRRACHASGE